MKTERLVGHLGVHSEKVDRHLERDVGERGVGKEGGGGDGKRGTGQRGRQPQDAGISPSSEAGISHFRRWSRLKFGP